MSLFPRWLWNQTSTESWLTWEKDEHHSEESLTPTPPPAYYSRDDGGGRFLQDSSWHVHKKTESSPASITSAPQMEPSAGGIFTMRSLLFMPRPQVALQASHSPHSVTRQLLGAKAKSRRHGRVQTEPSSGNCLT